MGASDSIRPRRLGGGKRGQPRRVLRYRVLISLDGETTRRSCTLADVSKSGARIRLGAPCDLTEQVFLFVSDNSTRGRCARVVWQNDLEAGLRFEPKGDREFPENEVVEI